MPNTPPPPRAPQAPGWLRSPDHKIHPRLYPTADRRVGCSTVPVPTAQYAKFVVQNSYENAVNTFVGGY